MTPDAQIRAAEREGDEGRVALLARRLGLAWVSLPAEEQGAPLSRHGNGSSSSSGSGFAGFGGFGSGDGSGDGSGSAGWFQSVKPGDPVSISVIHSRSAQS